MGVCVRSPWPSVCTTDPAARLPAGCPALCPVVDRRSFPSMSSLHPASLATPWFAPPTDKVVAAVQERARLDYTARVVGEAAASTRTVVQRLRFALAAGGLAQRLAWSAQRLQGRRPPAGGSVGGGSVDDMGVGLPRY